MEDIKLSNGKKKVELKFDDFAVGKPQLMTMRNGFQWSGVPIDKDLAKMIVDVLSEYLERK